MRPDDCDEHQDEPYDSPWGPGLKCAKCKRINLDPDALRTFGRWMKKRGLEL